MEGNRMKTAFRDPEAAAQQSGGGFRANDLIVPRKMVGMGMGDKCPWLWIPGIQPKIGLGQVKTALESNFDHVWERNPE
jgi:hypothetical protein